MRVAILVIAAGKDSPDSALSLIAKAYAGGLEAAGQRPEIISPDDNPGRIASFDYVVVATEPAGAFGKLPARLSAVLKQIPGLAGRRSYALMRKAGLRPQSALSKLMAAMEAEGMCVNDAEVIVSAESAGAAGRGAPVERG